MFYSAHAVISLSGQGAIVHYENYLYELECNIPQCKWKILPQTIGQDNGFPTILALPPGVGC